MVRRGAAFRKVRKDKGKTQEEFAATLGIEVKDIEDIEQGRVPATGAQLATLANEEGIIPFEITEIANKKEEELPRNICH